MSQDLTSYGYFFHPDEFEDGKHLVLPSGHGTDDRIVAQNGQELDLPFCALFYSDDGENFTTFSGHVDYPYTLALDKDSRFAFECNKDTFEINSDINTVFPFVDPFDIKSYSIAQDYNKATTRLNSLKDLNITINWAQESEHFFDVIGIRPGKGEETVKSDNLVHAIIQLSQSI